MEVVVYFAVDEEVFGEVGLAPVEGHFRVMWPRICSNLSDIQYCIRRCEANKGEKAPGSKTYASQ